MKAKFIFSLIMVFVLVGCAVKPYTPPPSYAPPSVNYFQRGRKYLDEVNYNLAIQDFTEYIKRNSDYNEGLAAAYANRCLAFRMKEEFDLAVRDCSEAIRLNPKLLYPYRDRGYSFLEKEQYELAIRDFTEWIYLDANEANAYAGRGLSYSKKGNYDSAIKDLTEAIRLNSSNAELYKSRAIVYCATEDYDNAIRDRTEAIRLSPQSWHRYSNRAFTYLDMGNFDKAEADWRKAAELNSDTRGKAGYLENIGLIYLKQGKWKTALAHTDSVNALRDDLAWNWLFRAIAAHQMGNDTNASSAYGKWSTLRKADDVRKLTKYLPKRLHVYLNELPTTLVTTRTVPTLVSWRAPRKTRILSVGVGDFKDTAIPKIDYAESDARGFASLAKSSGIPEENISHLTNKDACRNDITDALIKLKMATTDRSETAIFYFSGHGAPLIKNGKIVDAALVPYNARENSLEYTGIKISTLQELLSDTKGNWIVILDACFSGREGRSLMAKNIKGICVVPKDFTVAPKSTKNNWWITATSGDNFANDFPKEKSGLFTYYFLKALNGEKSVDANEDGLISVKEAFNWTKEEVQAVSAKSLGRLQVPELIGKGDTILTIPR